MDELDCVIRAKLDTDILVYGNPSTGKTSLVLKCLEKYDRKHVLIDCANIVDFKLLLNKIYYQITKTVQKFETIEDLVDQLLQIDHEIVLILKNLQMIPTQNITFDLFKLFHNIGIEGLSVCFIVTSTTIPIGLLTSGLLKFYFKNLNEENVVSMIIESGVIPGSTISKNFIKLIADTYYPYTTDVKELTKLVTNNWPIFSAPLKDDPNLSFMNLYNLFKPELSDKLIAKTVTKEIGVSQSKLSPMTSILVISSYLASYNDPKFDFTLFSKLKEIRSGKRTFARRVRNGNVRKIINNLKWFEFERMISILKSIYKDCDYYESKDLQINLATYIEFNNLVTLRLLVRNENRYKINCDLSLVKRCSNELGFNLENYLAE